MHSFNVHAQHRETPAALTYLLHNDHRQQNNTSAQYSNISSRLPQARAKSVILKLPVTCSGAGHHGRLNVKLKESGEIKDTNTLVNSVRLKLSLAQKEGGR
eukprot:6206962-Pleurochrysis_carterae.AAC.1